MTDVFIAAATGVCVLVFAWAHANQRRARHSVQLMRRVMPACEQPPEAGRGPWLEGLARRIASTSPGARLHKHALASHPSVPFSDYVAYALVSALAVGLASWILTYRVLPTLLFSLGAPFGVDRIAARMHGTRSARIEKQLPDALGLQAGALRAGQSLGNSLRIVAGEVRPPLGEDLSHMLREVDLGRPVDRALEDLSARVGSADLDLWVTSMLVHRQTGGNLAALLDALARRVSQRIHLRQEIKAMTAQGRLSGIVVALAPLTFFALLSIGSREQMEFLYTTPLGWTLLAAGLTLNGLGFWWIRWALRVRT